MKKLLGIVVLGLLLFANTAKSEVIDLNNCFTVQHSKWHATKFYNFKNRYEESSWSINISTGLITQIEIWSESYRDDYYKKNKEVLPKEEFIELNMTNYTSNLIIGKSYIDDPIIRQTFFNSSDTVVKEEVRINLNDKTVKLIENPTGTKFRSYNKVNQIAFKGTLSYEDFVEFYEPRIWFYKCEKTSDTGEPDITSGTAFFINNKGNLLTNHHVVDGCVQSKINYFGKEYDAKLISTDKNLDLALLKVDLKPKSYINFSSSMLKKRQPITIAGYPLGEGFSDDLKINDGKISSLKGFENNTNEVTVDIAINPGNSGGPIVDVSGNLVAVAVSGIRKEVAEGINFGIKSWAAANFLSVNDIQPNMSKNYSSINDDKLNQLLEESTVYTFCELKN